MDFQNVAFQEAVSVSSNDLHSFTVTPPKKALWDGHCELDLWGNGFSTIQERGQARTGKRRGGYEFISHDNNSEKNHHYLCFQTEVDLTMP